LLRVVTAVVLGFLVAGAAGAQIILPDTIPPHTPVIASATSVVPEGAEVKFTWRLSGDKAYLVTVDGNTRAHIWAPPGTYTLDVIIVWIDFETIEVNGKELKVLKGWDLQQYSKPFTIGDKPPGPGPEPDPGPTPTGFKAHILAAYKAINAPAGSAAKVAKVYRSVAAQAAANPNVYTPALMVDQAKNKVVTELTAAERRAWAPFWPKMNDAFKELKLKEDDLPGFIEHFTQFCDVLEKV
jgi:hypothetical protein